MFLFLFISFLLFIQFKKTAAKQGFISWADFLQVSQVLLSEKARNFIRGNRITYDDDLPRDLLIDDTVPVASSKTAKPVEKKTSFYDDFDDDSMEEIEATNNKNTKNHKNNDDRRNKRSPDSSLLEEVEEEQENEMNRSNSSFLSIPEIPTANNNNNNNEKKKIMNTVRNYGKKENSSDEEEEEKNEKERRERSGTTTAPQQKTNRFGRNEEKDDEEDEEQKKEMKDDEWFTRKLSNTSNFSSNFSLTDSSVGGGATDTVNRNKLFQTTNTTATAVNAKKSLAVENSSEEEDEEKEEKQEEQEENDYLRRERDKQKHIRWKPTNTEEEDEEEEQEEKPKHQKKVPDDENEFDYSPPPPPPPPHSSTSSRPQERQQRVEEHVKKPILPSSFSSSSVVTSVPIRSKQSANTFSLTSINDGESESGSPFPSPAKGSNNNNNNNQNRLYGMTESEEQEERTEQDDDDNDNDNDPRRHGSHSHNPRQQTLPLQRPTSAQSSFIPLNELMGSPQEQQQQTSNPPQRRPSFSSSQAGLLTIGTGTGNNNTNPNPHQQQRLVPGGRVMSTDSTATMMSRDDENENDQLNEIPLDSPIDRKPGGLSLHQPPPLSSSSGVAPIAEEKKKSKGILGFFTKKKKRPSQTEESPSSSPVVVVPPPQPLPHSQPPSRSSSPALPPPTSSQSQPPLEPPVMDTGTPPPARRNSKSGAAKVFKKMKGVFKFVSSSSANSSRNPSPAPAVRSSTDSNINNQDSGSNVTTPTESPVISKNNRKSFFGINKKNKNNDENNGRVSSGKIELNPIITDEPPIAGKDKEKEKEKESNEKSVPSHEITQDKEKAEEVRVTVTEIDKQLKQPTKQQPQQSHGPRSLALQEPAKEQRTQSMNRKFEEQEEKEEIEEKEITTDSSRNNPMNRKSLGIADKISFHHYHSEEEGEQQQEQDARERDREEKEDSVLLLSPPVASQTPLPLPKRSSSFSEKLSRSAVPVPVPLPTAVQRSKSVGNQRLVTTTTTSTGAATVQLNNTHTNNNNRGGPLSSVTSVVSSYSSTTNKKIVSGRGLAQRIRKSNTVVVDNKEEDKEREAEEEANDHDKKNKLMDLLERSNKITQTLTGATHLVGPSSLTQQSSFSSIPVAFPRSASSSSFFFAPNGKNKQNKNKKLEKGSSSLAQTLIKDMKSLSRHQHHEEEVNEEEEENEDEEGEGDNSTMRRRIRDNGSTGVVRNRFLPFLNKSDSDDGMSQEEENPVHFLQNYWKQLKNTIEPTSIVLTEKDRKSMKELIARSVPKYTLLPSPSSTLSSVLSKENETGEEQGENNMKMKISSCDEIFKYKERVRLSKQSPLVKNMLRIIQAEEKTMNNNNNSNNNNNNPLSHPTRLGGAIHFIPDPLYGLHLFSSVLFQSHLNEFHSPLLSPSQRKDDDEEEEDNQQWVDPTKSKQQLFVVPPIHIRYRLNPQLIYNMIHQNLFYTELQSVLAFKYSNYLMKLLFSKNPAASKRFKKRFFVIMANPKKNPNIVSLATRSGLTSGEMINKTVLSSTSPLSSSSSPGDDNHQNDFLLVEFRSMVESSWGTIPLQLKRFYSLNDLLFVLVDSEKKKEGKEFTLCFHIEPTASPQELKASALQKQKKNISTQGNVPSRQSSAKSIEIDEKLVKIGAEEEQEHEEEGDGEGKEQRKKGQSDDTRRRTSQRRSLSKRRRSLKSETDQSSVGGYGKEEELELEDEEDDWEGEEDPEADEEEGEEGSAGPPDYYYRPGTVLRETTTDPTTNPQSEVYQALASKKRKDKTWIKLTLQAETANDRVQWIQIIQSLAPENVYVNTINYQ
jgi:hypothetical protein